MLGFFICKINWTLNSELWLMISVNAVSVLKTGPRVSMDFCRFLTPHKLNFELLKKTLGKKMKRNAWKLSYILLFWKTVFIRSCPVLYMVHFPYSKVLFSYCRVRFPYCANCRINVEWPGMTPMMLSLFGRVRCTSQVPLKQVLCFLLGIQ